ncbi:hypothetical protein DITRI_Ditri06bG0155700 [Diplodiscus trichospermus]
MNIKVLISGYDNGLVRASFDLFHKLVITGDGFDSGTIIILLHGCAPVADTETGKVLHGYTCQKGLDMNLTVSTAMADLYIKYGALKEATCLDPKPNCTLIAIRIAERVCKDGSIFKDVLLWKSMITGYGVHGQGHKALDNRMLRGTQAKSNYIHLSVCSHLELVKQGSDHSIRPTEKHYDCNLIIAEHLSRTF